MYTHNMKQSEVQEHWERLDLCILTPNAMLDLMNANAHTSQLELTCQRIRGHIAMSNYNEYRLQHLLMASLKCHTTTEVSMHLDYLSNG